MIEALYEASEFSRCEKACKKAIKEDKTDLSPRIFLCHSLLSLKKYEKVIAQAGKALKLPTIAPADRGTFYNLKANAESRLGKAEAALVSYWKASKADPSRIDIKYAIALSYFRKNEFPLSLKLTLEILNSIGNSESEHFAEAMFLFSQLADPKSSKDLLKSAPELASQKSSHSRLYFGLGNLFDQVGDYEKALENYRRANSIQRKASKYDITKDIQLMERYRDTFDEDYFNQKSSGPSVKPITPIFIIGMPRTGSSLLENLLGAHSDIYQGGEVSWLTDSLAKAVARYGNPSFDKMKELATDNEFSSLIRENYFSQVPTQSKRYLTDKMPGNAFFLWLIKYAFPEAIVIATQREKEAIVWSCYRTCFQVGHHYSESLLETRRYLEKHDGLVQFWGKMLGKNFIQLNYERLVEETQSQMGSILDKLELAREPACFSSGSTTRAVDTASRVQVTKPIYKDANENWKHYGGLFK